MSEFSIVAKVTTGQETIDSQTLLKMVNEARKLCSEKTVRNNDFIARVKDELEGETYEIFVGQKNGAEIEVITMTYKQALRVAARESKAVRRSLVDQLEAMQKRLTKAPKAENRGLDALRRAQALKLTMESLGELYDMFPHLATESKQLMAAGLINPLVGNDVVPVPELCERYYTAGEIGKLLNISANKVGRIANEHKLKTEEYGKFFLDKSAHSQKHVESFRYNAKGLAKIAECWELEELLKY